MVSWQSMRRELSGACRSIRYDLSHRSSNPQSLRTFHTAPQPSWTATAPRPVPAADKPTRRTLHQREAIVPAPLPIRADNPADERYSVRGGLATVGIGLVLGAGYLIVNGGIGALAVEPVIGQPVAPAEATPPLAATTSAPASPTPNGYRPAAPHIRRGGASAPARPAISAEPVARPPEPGPPTPAPTTSPPAPTPSGSPDPETSTRPSPSTSPDPVGSGAAAKPAGR